MTQYISKSALVAEIERKIHNIDYEGISDRNIGQKLSLYHILYFLDTLEVKEVDIEDVVHGTVDFPLIGHDFPNIYLNYKELKEYCDRKGIKDDDKVKLIIIKDM